MEGKENNATVNVNIYGGTNIVQPIATQATQIINGSEVVTPDVQQQEQPHAAPSVSDDKRQSAKSLQDSQADVYAIRLRKYVDSEERLQGYLQELRHCESATELAKVVVSMYNNEPNLLDFEIKKERFIKIVSSLATDVKTGNTVSNIRARIKEQLKTFE